MRGADLPVGVWSAAVRSFVPTTKDRRRYIRRPEGRRHEACDEKEYFMSDESKVGEAGPAASTEALGELAAAVRAENPEAFWRWLDRFGNWEEREREALQAHPERSFLRRVLIGGREKGEWWWMSAVLSLDREWTPAHLRQIPPQIWGWPGLAGKTPEMIYDFTADRLLWCDAGARIDAETQSEQWLAQLEAQLGDRGVDGG
jgi:hypothetical protein